MMTYINFDKQPTLDNIDLSRTIDLLRGIAIALMIWGHCIQYCNGGRIDFFENAAYKCIYSFHMPLFMLISGYLFYYSEKKRNLHDLISRKINTLLYPILSCSIINVILTIGIDSILKGTPEAVLEAIRIYSLWFLWSVLLSSIVLAITVKCFDSMIMKGLCLILGIGILAVFPGNELHLFMYPYFIIGYIIANFSGRLRKCFNWIGALSCVCFALMLGHYSTKHYIYTTGICRGGGITESIKIDLFRWAIGLAGSFAIIWIVVVITSRFKRTELTAFLEKLGQDSLAIYSLSASFLSYWLPVITDRVLLLVPFFNVQNHLFLYNFVITPFITTVYLCLFMQVIKLLKKCGAYRLIFNR